MHSGAGVVPRSRVIRPPDQTGSAAQRLTPRQRALVALLLSVFLVLAVLSMQRMSITLDERAHDRYGFQLLNRDAHRFDNSKMPFSALNALPRKLAQLFPPGPTERRLSKLETGRYATVLGALVFAMVVFRWAHALYGASGGLLALFLFTWDPNIVAHARLTTTDIYATGMTTAALYSFWRFVDLGGWPRAWASAIVLGLAQLAKYTCAYLFPIFVLIALGYHLADLWRAARARRLGELGGCLGRFLGYSAFFLAISVAVINVGFLGQGTLHPLGALDFRSAGFHFIQSALAPFPWLRVPVPYPYVEGLDWVLADERAGVNVYLLGQLGNDNVPGRRFPTYYLYVWLYKVPLGTQALLLAAVVAYALRFRWFRFRRDEWFLLCPVLFFAAYFVFVFNAQLGIRYTLVVFPLIHVFCGSLLAGPRSLARWGRVGVGIVAASIVVSVLSYYPHFISYFNELVWDRKQAYTILSDSNIDWGQSEWYLRRYRKAHPEAIIEPPGPVVGTIVVPVLYVTGVEYYEKFRWIRENGIQPVDHIAYSYLVFRITPGDLEWITRTRR
jgi:4-amino-4-deoxy-L-arabinose transferase-like glycosyltransferase